MSCTRIFVRSQLAMVMLHKNNQLTTKDMPDITDKFSRNEETKKRRGLKITTLDKRWPRPLELLPGQVEYLCF